MYNVNNDASATWGTEEVKGVSEAAKSFTKPEDAKGWYSYTLTIDNDTFTGVFYYDGTEA